MAVLGAADVQERPPTGELECAEIRDIVNRETPPREGAVWCVVAFGWWLKWRAYSGYSETAQAAARPVVARQRFHDPIANEELLDPASTAVPVLRANLSVGVDFYLVPLDAWRLLSSWYGGGPAICRTAVAERFALRTVCNVELYPLLLSVKKETRQDNWRRADVLISKKATVQQLMEEALSALKMTPGTPCRLTSLADSQALKRIPLNDRTQTLEKAGLATGHCIVVEVAKVDGTYATSSSLPPVASVPSTPLASSGSATNLRFPPPAAPATPAADLSSSVGPIASAAAPVASTAWPIPMDPPTRAASSAATSRVTSPLPPITSSAWSISIGGRAGGLPKGDIGGARKEKDKEKTQPGKCGLQNLGNTCFMNSALQCLSYTRALREFFLSNRHEQAINTDNPLGSGGELARSFAQLIQSLWSGEHTSFSPRSFKSTLAKYAPQFSGWQQQDCQELTAYLLDGIHEDLNLVRKKEYVELKDSDGRDDQKAAAEAWSNHLKRNQSVIVDLFQGQLKSTLQCPVCDKISITFDPFMYLSVPLQVETERTKVIDVIVVPELRPTQGTTKHRLRISESATITSLRTQLASATRMDAATFVVASMWNKKINGYLADTKSITDLTDPTIAFESAILPEAKANPRQFVKLELTQKGANCSRESHLPLILVVRKELQNAALYQHVADRLLVLAGTRHQSGHGRRAERMRDADGPVPLLAAREASIGLDVSSMGSGISKYPFTLKAGGFRCVLCSNRTCMGCTLSCNSECTLSTARASLASETESAVALDVIWDEATEDIVSNASWPVTDAPSVSQIPDATTPLAYGRKADAKQMRLEDCLDLFTRREKLGENDTWYCPQCKQHQRAFKEFQIWRLPEYLVVHLKRFQYTTKIPRKLDFFVEFPLEGLDLRKWLVEISPDRGSTTYDLYAVCNHTGSLYGGHYTAQCKADDAWFEFNDSWVSGVKAPPADQIVTPEAYLLFYQRRA